MLRRTAESTLRALATQYPVVTLTGPRQSGKTTLTRSAFPHLHYVNLEQADQRRFAIEDPRGFLRQHAAGAVFDEFQRVPDLASYLQAEVDLNPAPGRFILTGSEQLEVLNRVSQSLAGRTGLLKLLPFSLQELAAAYPTRPLERLIYSGFYPRIHDRALDPAQALGDYFATYVQRDLRDFMNIGNLALFERFVRLCAGRCGQLLNHSALAADAGVSHTTASSWISLLEASYIVFRLPPYFWNTNKRLVKSPKLYFFDVGLAAHLLGIQSESHVLAHPLRSALFENLVVAEVLKYFWHRGRRAALHFFRDSDGNEIDLLLELGRGVFPIEIKAGETVNPDYFKGLKSFARNYRAPPPNGGAVVYGGTLTYRHSDSFVLPPEGIAGLMAGLT